MAESSELAGTGFRRARWIALGVLVVLMWSFVGGCTEALTAEYGAGTVESGAVYSIGFLLATIVLLVARTWSHTFPPRWSAGVPAILFFVTILGVGAAVQVGEAQGVAHHNARTEARAQACRNGIGEAVAEFGRLAGRVIPSDGNTVMPSDRGCIVLMALDPGVDAVAVIDAAVGDHGWTRDGSTWHHADGFIVTAEVAEPDPEAGPTETEVTLIGSRP